MSYSMSFHNNYNIPNLHIYIALATSSPSSINGLTVGSVIVHERFGEGVVEKLEGSGLDAKACVRFQNVGTKQLLLRFAKFTLKN